MSGLSDGSITVRKLHIRVVELGRLPRYLVLVLVHSLSDGFFLQRFFKMVSARMALLHSPRWWWVTRVSLITHTLSPFFP